MKKSKLLTLSAALLLTLGVVSCGNGSSSSSSASSEPVTFTVDDETTMQDAGEYLWQLIKDKNGTTITASFDVNNIIVIDGNRVSVSWDISVNGSTDGVVLKDSSKTGFETVYVGYYDGKINEATTFTLTPSLTYKGVTKTLKDLLGEDKDSITGNVPVLVLGNHADWVKLASDADTSINIKGTVIDIIDPSGSSSSKGSFYFVDEEGYGYYAYNAKSSTSTYAKSGDTVIVTGTRSDYSGQQEFKKACTYQIISSGENNPTFIDATEDFKKAANNKTASIDDKYQNRPIVLNNCTPTSISGSYYYFTVDGGTTKYNIYDNSYFLTEAQRKTFTDTFQKALDEGSTFTVKGISTVYSSAYQVYGCTAAPEIITITGTMTQEEKAANVENDIKAAIASIYEKEESITFSLPNYVKDYSVALKSEGGTAVAIDGKTIKVTPVDDDEENVVTVSYTIGETTYNTDVTIKTKGTAVVVYSATIDRTSFNFTDGTATSTAISNKNKEDTITVSATCNGLTDRESDNEFTFANKSAGNMLINAPEGYIIDTVVVETWTYWNLSLYAGTDATGTALDDSTTVTAVNSAGKAHSITVNNSSLYIVNASNYANSAYFITVNLKAASK